MGMSMFAYNATASEKASHPHWAYDGEHGPAHWGHMSEEFAACSQGKTQSPIDISGASEEDTADIAFSYKPSKLNILNNGHTVQVNYDKGSSIKVDGVDFQLVQFHFHTPSEHTVGGKSFGQELHLVHKNDKGELAVVGVLIEKGKENAAYKKIWSNLPRKADEKKEVNAEINAEELLPKTRAAFRYTGSLTTPPCSEGVNWIVLKSPIQMSAKQIDSIQKIMHRNNRPVQPIQGRKVTSDTVSH
ncbi:MAG: carbonic anhydrase family protein [Deltaproteobacteria bacterium]|nr:carbonic anhydrase family protein [Deltaproteobacteria bacterium]